MCALHVTDDIGNGIFPDFVQHLIAPRFRALFLIALVAIGRRSEAGAELFCECDGTRLRERENGIALYGIDHGQRIPHFLPCVAIVLHIDLLDGVNVRPVDVAEH